jgi:MFS family permease
LIQTYTRSFNPLKNPNFRMYIIGQAVSLLGTWMQSTAQSWLVWELTRSESALGTVIMLNSLPLFILAPWAGGFADRFNRRMILLVTQSIAMTLAFLLAFLVQTHLVQVWHIYLFSFVLGVVAALDFPAQQAFIGDLTGMSQVRQSITLNVMALQIARMLGPALAGFIVNAVGSAAAFWINGLSFMFVLYSIFMVKSHRQEIHKRNSGRGQFLETLDYVRTQPRMMDLLGFAALATFFGFSILNILPAVADRMLHGDSRTFGLLLGASGAGAFTSLVFLLPLSQAAKRIGRIVGGAVMWMGAFYFLLSRSASLPLSMVAMFFVSLGTPLVVTTGLGVMQLLAPGNMRARIISLFTMFTFGLQPISSILIGYAAEWIGVQTIIMINAVCLMAGGALMLLLRDGLLQWELKPLVEPILSEKEKNLQTEQLIPAEQRLDL